MLKHDLGIIYEYQNHKWINQQISCGCIIAVCTDIDIKKEDRDYVVRYNTKISNLQSIMGENINSKDDEIKQRFKEFENEILESRKLLSNFIISKRDEYNFPIGTDSNSEYYYIKLKSDKNCSSGI